MGTKKKKKTLPVRLNIIFFFVFLLFSALILRLGFVQIVYGEDYKRELEKTEDVTVNTSVPRGKMYDTTGKVIVDNVAEKAITYTNTGESQEVMIETAEKLSDFIEKDTKKVTERDKKDYWILKNEKEAAKKVSDKEKEELAEKYPDKDEYNDKVYKLQLEKITESDLNTLTDHDLEVLAIYREFISGYKFTPQMVKNKDVTDEEFAIVSENLESLPGVDTTTDWERSYAFEDTLKSVLGNVSSSEKGLPAERLDYYTSRGYSLNDRVGTSYLELEYEDVLKGQKEKVRNKTDKSGEIVDTEVITEGKRGNDLVLSIDMELQREVEKIIEEELKVAKTSAGTKLLDRAYVVLMNPNTGDVLSMAGKKLVTNEETGKVEVQDDALGNITTTYNVGSVVKGATVLTGYKTGAITPGTVWNDTEVKIGQTVKKSWTTMGPINDLTALQRSSNVYMFRTVMQMAQANYVYGQPLSVQLKDFTLLRNEFAQYGLGIRTGIDLPNEQVGFKGQDTLPGFLLDLSIGQYDTYSNMQLAQYVSTIANGGNRMEPHIVKEIREPVADDSELGPTIETIKPKVLNKLDLKEEWIERVQQGFEMVAQTPKGTAYSNLGGKDYSPAAKTGTAEAFYDGPDRADYGKEPPAVMNLSLISYAPSENPEVAMAVMVPWAYQGSVDNGANKKIGERVLDTYFNLKKQRETPETEEAQETEETQAE
ncbi:peptidoglycan D,D-transpeptidase FtsI family protein [Bacillus sp. B1-b2]|uniref:peptidoglycan D,D-transpeptidase FtsI family protein n=1 Tax=Bacillus sp. B1-b2 TaxID=2653201 RepID=UPI0012625C29|nr:penicillin-binding protein 2 [Bacillus sp. B1-b2]KAB7670042.1 penicillin-binding protein 2 [Bacillus sp. B1-b2]